MAAPFQVYGTFLETAQTPELGPGPRSGVTSLADLNRSLESIAQQTPLSIHEQKLIRALILLWHDHLEAAHGISQEIETPEGSYVHAILHRREPDYGNAKYWFRRVGQHPAYAALADAVRAERGGEKLLSGGRWDPFAFVDACEQAEREPERSDLLRNIQATEFRILLKQLCGG